MHVSLVSAPNARVSLLLSPKVQCSCDCAPNAVHLVLASDLNLLVALFLCKEFHFLVPGGFNINVVFNVILRAVDNTDVSTFKRQLFALKDILKI